MTKAHKRVEEAPRESEELFRSLVELSPYAIAVHSDERMVFVNRAGTELLGATDPEEIIGKPLWDFVHRDHLAAVRKRIQRTRPEGKEVNLIEEKLVRLDGRAIDVEMAAIAITYQGKPARQVVFRDISKRKQAEEAVRESEVRYRTLVETARDVIFTLSVEGMLLSLNSAFETVTGWSRAEWVGKPFAPIIHADDRAAAVENFRRILQGEVPPNFEVRILTKSGEYLTGEFGARPLIADAKVVGAFGIVRDITERKRAEEATERVRRRDETLVETSPVGVVVVDASGRVVLVNREAERITDFSYKRGDPLEALHQGAVRRRPDGTEYAPEELPVARALYQGETVRAEEIRFHFADGRTVPTLVNAVPISGTEGEVAGAIVIIQDITPLEELEKLRGEFLGIVSHELKTPVTAIKGSAAMALTGRDLPDAPQARELFEIIDEQADRLAELIDNLLDMTRIEAGSLTVSPEATDVRTVLEEARATSARSHALHEIQIQVPDDLPTVNADRRRLAQVLLNLLSNAAKFSPEGEPITITVEDDSSRVMVHVRDRGRGIPADKLPHLFKKFSRVHERQGRGLQGSGLGLAICKGIVEAHGGRIWVDSEGEGKGSTFSFTLPVATEESAAPVAETTRRAVHLGKMGRPGERTRILAVDDEPRVLGLLQRVLDGAGYQVAVTSDPSQVPRLVELEEPDLVLLDLFLPGTTGFDLLKQIREFSGVPVIFLTVSDKEENAVQALKAGADDYITKPFSPSELVARIAAALRRRVVPDVTEVRPPFVLGDLTVEFVERRVTVGGRPVSLSATEYKLLYELATHAGQVLTHDQILHRVWGPRYSGETEVIRSFVRNLRRKLGDHARHPRYIFTEPQVGYRMPKP
jgi:PAS domain S-box-containing protein